LLEVTKCVAEWERDDSCSRMRRCPPHHECWLMQLIHCWDAQGRKGGCHGNVCGAGAVLCCAWDAFGRCSVACSWRESRQGRIHWPPPPLPGRRDGAQLVPFMGMVCKNTTHGYRSRTEVCRALLQCVHLSRRPTFCAWTCASRMGGR
jgi:hypothetical protein